MTRYDQCMTMLSFRVDDHDATELQAWVERLGVEKSEFLRDALRRQLLRLASERDAEIWERQPLTASESALAEIADWGPAEDWSDWVDDTEANASR
jgi:Arc/MetJ-type ribon-helix-helix transcriptional regulator